MANVGNHVRQKLRGVKRAMRLALAAPDRVRRARAANFLAAVPADDGAARAVAECLRQSGFAPWQLGAQVLSSLFDAYWRELPAVGSEAIAGRSTGKQFFMETLSAKHLRKIAPFVDVALSRPLLDVLVQAMGMVPHLESVECVVSHPSGDALSASQMWHQDVNDVKIVKLFVYLADVAAENGPFTYIDAGDSAKVPACGEHYMDDDYIGQFVPRSKWHEVPGPAGMAFLIDTRRCLHYGSRCKVPRVVYIATYSSGLRFMKFARSWPELLEARVDGLDQLQRQVVGMGKI